MNSYQSKSSMKAHSKYLLGSVSDKMSCRGSSLPHNSHNLYHHSIVSKVPNNCDIPPFHHHSSAPHSSQHKYHWISTHQHTSHMLLHPHIPHIYTHTTNKTNHLSSSHQNKLTHNYHAEDMVCMIICCRLCMHYSHNMLSSM